MSNTTNQADKWQIVKKILLTNWFLFSMLTLLIILFNIFEVAPLRSIENTTYDGLNRLKKNPGSDVVLVAIDDKSINEIGAWPWPRSYIGDMIDTLHRAGIAAVGLDILYTDEEINPGVQEIDSIRKSLRNSKGRLKQKSYATIDKKLRIAARKLDNDRKLTIITRAADKVVIPLSLYDIGKSSVQNTLPKILGKHSLTAPNNSSTTGRLLGNLLSPIEVFRDDFVSAGSSSLSFYDLMKASKALGHNAILEDGDHVVRRHPLLIRHHDQLIPSLPMQLSLVAAKSNIGSVRITTGNPKSPGITIGKSIISTDRQYRMLINFGNKQSSVPQYSFTDVAKGKVGAKELKGKAALIGITAKDLHSYFMTPVKTNMSAAEINAISTANIMTKSLIKRPGWAWLLESAILLYFMFFLLLVIPRVNWKVGTLILGIFLATWLITAVVLYIGPGYWFHVWSPFVLSICGMAIIQFYSRFQFADNLNENTETNKMLGLSFQNQGMLDMAFDKFMKCSMKDPSVKDLLYNLGLDFERKRMHNKAVAVYEYILRAGKFKDIKERIKKLKDAGEKVMIGGGKPRADATMMLDSVETKPTLGRYEVIKELGQGAIGTVYLGRDPKINREVAIKVLRYDEVSGEQLDEVKKRFYHEAEAAGRLSHPNIVTIYDAGEDYDLTYMAMELLDGQDLTGYCKNGNLLPPQRVLEIISSVARALEYAHKNGVVHRDIKPANIMLLKNGQVKVADFGIARIIDSSRTHTGDILGTPNYMSPEQVSGKKVDGRSDLFSLGAVMYELLTGEKPFQSDTMAAIMYNIANASYTPIKELAPDIPDCCITIVDKLLTKGVTKRYQNANIVYQNVQECFKKLKG